ncbi:MAG: aspartyl protease family protein [Alphaproteobacteria bacterium]
MNRAFCTIALIWASLAGPALAAPACPFTPDASVPIGYDRDDGRPKITVQMNGKDEFLVVDTGAPISLIKDSVADELKLPLKPYPRTYTSVAGISPSAIATVDTLSVGALTGHELSFFLVPSVQIPPPLAGSFGADFLQGWDVDFDFGKDLINFISSEKCGGDPVYWTKRPYVSLPLRLGDDLHLRATVALDGKEVTAVLDTGSAGSLIGLALAAQLFDIRDAGEHTFRSLAFNGVSIDNPTMFVADGTRFTGNELLIGMPVLKQLHLYVSYQSKTAYLTRADAR